MPDIHIVRDGTKRPCSPHHIVQPVKLALPFWRYFELFRKQPYACLLDSARAPHKLCRYSFMGSNPAAVYKAKRQQGVPPEGKARIEIIHRRDVDGSPLASPRVEQHLGNAFDGLRALTEEYRVERAPNDAPVPFLVGAMGYFGYEAGYFIEKLPDLGKDQPELPDIYMLFMDVVLAHDHERGESYLSIVGRGTDAKSAQARAEALRDETLARLQQMEQDPPAEWTAPQAPVGAKPGPVEINAHFDEAGYIHMVREAKEHITAGDIFEVCTTHRLDSPLRADPWDLYRELRRINPAPFACYLHLPEAYVVSSSPERFLSLDRQRVAESRPIKGTRPRGKSAEEDDAMLADLSTNLKDRAENLMIVDLVRSDFGRVCKFNTVHVPELLTIERYATVFHLVSAIRGQLEDDKDPLDLLQACFPGGSMTGAPKIEAMKIIDRLEPVKRGIYSGSIGYLDFSGVMDLNIVIRTFVVVDGRCYYNVGGAVVADSDPRGEYLETMDKARALIAALNNLSGGAS
ncbi:aminodeoxychorismate synthase component I [Stigmatella sp. ncwal1]|uniref:aminodeoxychorismate synthase n=1 Tax=Stigmatella ashevillensis TaxID=2995309 RepID=A0ABT5DG27_9BACT|nr:aminodeoxychorismate synthase component I [Stigmatella ashevillena]MDC0712612.1 aminodeoxychorismate synthase component I [Stigmatella ashevillena]